MAGKYVLDNFRIGDKVIPVIQRQLIFEVTGIDTEEGLVICRLQEMPEVEHLFKPEELVKEIMDFEISEDE